MPLSRSQSLTVWLLAGVLLFAALFGCVVVRRQRSLQSRPETLSTDLAQWQAYEGDWAIKDGIVTDRTGGRGDKLMTGDPTLNDFVYRAELRFDSDRDYEFGDAGLVLRASNLTVGTDSLYGYYVGLRPGTQTLKLGRMQDEYIDLSLRKLDVPLLTGTWYRVDVQVKGCMFFIQVLDPSGRTVGAMHYDDAGCVIRAGQVGLRSYGMVASWRALSIQPLP